MSDTYTDAMATANADSELTLSAAINADLARAADTVASPRRAMALTGAGLSVENGIPPFRGPGVLWHAAGGSNRSAP
jgi:hypothetical protein